ncbi:MAG: phage tail protein [Clostridia bacterium]|nr:phage tail protein [Clostridia bacterium]
MAITNIAADLAKSVLGMNDDSRYGRSSVVSFFSKFTNTGITENVMNFRFVVWLNSEFLAFQSVSGISQKREYEYITEGGNNDFPRALRKPISSPQQLVFKRGYRINKLEVNALWSGFGDSRQSESLEKENSIGMIFVLDRSGSIQSMYSFITMGMVSWELDELNAQKPQTLIETFTVNHRGITNVPVPWIEFDSILSTVKGVIDKLTGKKPKKVESDPKGNIVTEDDQEKSIMYKEIQKHKLPNDEEVKIKKATKDKETGKTTREDINGKKYVYDPKTGSETVVEPNGNATIYKKDGSKVLVDSRGKIIKAEDSGVKIEFDENGKKTKKTDENGVTTYNKDGEPEKTVAKDGSVTLYLSNPKRTEKTDKKGNVTTTYSNGDEIEKNKNGKVVRTKSVSPDGSSVETKDGVVTETDAVGNKTVRNA